MIGARLGAALALAFAVAAVGLAAAALMAALRDDEEAAGRLVQTRLVATEGDPVLFALDDFYAVTGEDGVLRALYVYPPGYFGHQRGCRVVWLAGSGESVGAFVDPCGGARFRRDGALIAGAADRGLDRFKTEPGIEGVIVDTRTLYCGPKAMARATATSIPTTGTPAATTATAEAADQREPEECERVFPGAE
jgi:hypothetical protein